MLSELELRSIFESPYKRTDWYKVLHQNFSVEVLRDKPVDITKRLKSNTYKAKAFELGSFETAEGHLIGLYEIDVPIKAQLYRNRKGLRDLLSDMYANDVDGALVVFVQDNKWRFTYVSEITVRDKKTGERQTKSTDPKRYTYLFGEGEKALTAARQFSSIKHIEDLFRKGIALETLQEAFNVQKMSEAFFAEYKRHYEFFTAHLTGEDEGSKLIGKVSPLLKATFGGTTDAHKKEARDFVKKMLGRIVFLYFLEKKGWLGVPVGEPWGKGDVNFLSTLFKRSADKNAFYSTVLVPLFFGALNTERKDDIFKLSTGEKVKVPFLNGGLFEDDNKYTSLLQFPQNLFENLFKFFDRYNFTVYEDSPDEQTVAVDPEMLGHIFENLLEENRKKTGAYYTPKEIVHYMCQESLVEYLHTALNGEKERVEREALEEFIKKGEAGKILDHEEAILTALYTVKVCDPAIGSGAFPMGVLMEIFHAVETMFEATTAVTKKVWKLKGADWVNNRAAVKLNIIQNSIYGVDIEQGAVDIARLRFWLSLVVDEDVPQPLPNLDYKIVVGNSLLSKFGNVVINIDWNPKGVTDEKAMQLITEQQVKLHLLQQKQHLFFISQHGNKQKLKEEIRNLKIEILANQVALTANQYKKANPFVNVMYQTPKEQLRNLQIKEQTAVYASTLDNLKGLRRNKEATLEFFDWKLDFPEVMNEKVAKASGFDIVIGNPPYLRIQGIRDVDSEFADYLNQNYMSATGSFDLYVVFLEKSISLIKHRGLVNFIMPVKWTNAAFGKGLRSIVKDTSCAKKIINFGAYQVFNASTYTALQWFKPNSTELEYYELTKDLPSNHELGRFLSSLDIADRAMIDSKKLSDEKWVLSIGKTSEILEKLNLQPRRISDVFEKIFQGIATSKDDVYFLYDCKFKGKMVHGYSKELEKVVEIETAFTKPLLKGEDVHRYDNIQTKRVVVFPYKLDNGSARLFEEKEIKTLYPSAYAYLKACEGTLRGREKGRFDINGQWYQFGRKQGITAGGTEKLLAPEISLGGNFAYDEKGEYYSTTKIYGYIKRASIKESYKFWLGLLNSHLFWFFIQQTGYVLRGGYFTFKTDYVLPFPIPENIPLNIVKKVEDLVDNILKEKKTYPDANTQKQEKQIDDVIYKLYELSEKDIQLLED